MLWSLENYVDLFCKEIYMKINCDEFFIRTLELKESRLDKN